MKCPNCGNENPPDYVFCDECGARLQGDDAGVGSQLSDASSQAGQNGILAGNTAVGASSAGSMGQQEGEHAGHTGYAASGVPSYAGSGPEAPTTQQYSTSSGQGHEGQGDSADAHGGGSTAGTGPIAADPMSGTSHATTGSSGVGATEAAAMGNGVAAQGVFEPADAEHAPSQSSANLEVPVTEDRVQSYDAGVGGGQQPDESGWPPAGFQMEQGADGGASLPGITPIDEQEQNAYADAASIVYAPGDVAGSSAGGEAVGLHGSGAGEALHYLDEAQRALGTGDWAGFGRGMADLRSYLTGLGSSSTGAGTGAASHGAIPASEPVAAGSGSYTPPVQSPQAATSDESSRQSGASDMDSIGSATQGAEYTTSGAGVQDQDYSGGTLQEQAGGDTLEPAAEAGTLPANAGTGIGAGYETGSGSAEQSGLMDSETVGAGADANAGVAGGLGAPTTGSGVQMSNNGGSENTMARLVIISTGAELSLPDQEEITVGREDPSSGIFPDVDLTPYGGEEGGVSRRHARMLCVNGEYFVEDLQSTNFTKLDGQRLPAHARERLEDGARIDFGRVATIFRRS